VPFIVQSELFLVFVQFERKLPRIVRLGSENLESDKSSTGCEE